MIHMMKKKDPYSWLDKHIAEQKSNRDIIDHFGGFQSQEMAERENWDAPKKKKRC